MIEFHTDKERTKEARKAKIFLDRRSRYTISGHVFLAGKDASAVRDKVFAANRARGGKCDICGKRLAHWDGDLEHIKGGRKLARCWCYHTVLNDGSICSNLQRSCSMFEKKSCHAKKHGRLIQFKWIPTATTNG